LDEPTNPVSALFAGLFLLWRDMPWRFLSFLGTNVSIVPRY
jgi:hypothetical protein